MQLRHSSTVLLFIFHCAVSYSMSNIDINRYINAEVTNLVRNRLVTWYRSNRRELPWRGDNTDIPKSPYSIWVSEIMLQQTRVETVVQYWNRWMLAFPTVETLARATQDDVNKIWAGLGYYRRAQNLLSGAQYVFNNHQGVIPSQKSQLLEIPGIGPYTAGAICSIAFHQAEPLVDGNVLRVFARLFAIREEVGGGKLEKISWAIAQELVHPDSPADFNQALMELGATVCLPTSPSCLKCPVQSLCAVKRIVERAKGIRPVDAVDLPAVHTFDIEDPPTPLSVTVLPFKKEKKKAKEVVLLVCVLRAILEDGEARYLMIRRPESGLLANQWEFPNIVLSGTKTDRKGSENELSDVEIMWMNEPPIKDLSVLEISSSSLSVPAAWHRLRDHLQQRCLCQFVSSSHNDDRTDGLNNDSPPSSVRKPFRVSSRGSWKLREPILHIFSHERHHMHVHVEDVNLNIDEDFVGDDISWRTETEIVAAGITTGCKKVLSEIGRTLSTKSNSNSKKEIETKMSSTPKDSLMSKKGGKRTVAVKVDVKSRQKAVDASASVESLRRFLNPLAGTSKTTPSIGKEKTEKVEVEVVDLLDSDLEGIDDSGTYSGHDLSGDTDALSIDRKRRIQPTSSPEDIVLEENSDTVSKKTKRA